MADLLDRLPANTKGKEILSRNFRQMANYCGPKHTAKKKMKKAEVL